MGARWTVSGAVLTILQLFYGYQRFEEALRSLLLNCERWRWTLSSLVLHLLLDSWICRLCFPRFSLPRSEQAFGIMHITQLEVPSTSSARWFEKAAVEINPIVEWNIHDTVDSAHQGVLQCSVGTGAAIGEVHLGSSWWTFQMDTDRSQKCHSHTMRKDAGHSLNSMPRFNPCTAVQGLEWGWEIIVCRLHCNTYQCEDEQAELNKRVGKQRLSFLELHQLFQIKLST